MKKKLYFDTEEELGRFVAGFFAAGGVAGFEVFKRDRMWVLEFLN